MTSTSSLLGKKGSGKPSIKDLSNYVVPEVGFKWFLLGFQLLDEQYVRILYTIRADHKTAEDSCIEMLDEWLRTDVHASWNKLIEGLKSPSVKLNDVAGQLQHMLLGKSKHGLSSKVKKTFGRLLPQNNRSHRGLYHQNKGNSSFYVDSSDPDDSETDGDTSLPPILEHNNGPEESLNILESFPPSTRTQQEASQSHNQRGTSLPRTMSQQYLAFGATPTRQRSATVNKSQLANITKARSLSDVSQAWTPVPRPRSIRPLSQAKNVSPEASHKADYTNLQQQLDSDDAKSQVLENSFKESINQIQQQLESSLTEKETKLVSLENTLNQSIAHLKKQLDVTESGLTEKNAKIQSLETSLNQSIAYLKKQLDGTESGLTEKNAKIQSLEKSLNQSMQQLDNKLIEKNRKIECLENSLNDGIAELQQQLNNTESSKNTKFQAFENSLNESIAHLQQQIDKLQSDLSQVLEKNTDYNKRDKEDKMVIKKLQEDVAQMQKELKQYRSGYNQNEAEKFKIQIDAEKQKAAEAQEALTQASAEVQEKDKEIQALKESQHQLQLTIQKLKDDFRQSKSEHDSKTIEYTKEIQKHKKSIDVEKDKTAKAQAALTQVSGELQEKAKETLALRGSQHELQLTVQKLDEALKQCKNDYDSKITQEIEKYKNLCDDEKQKSDKAQEALTKVSAELQEKILALEQSHHKLLCEKQNIETRLQDVLEQCDARIKTMEDSNKHLQVEKENITKTVLQQSFTENTNIREIQDRNALLLLEKEQEKEQLGITIKRLQDENNILKIGKNKLDSEQEVATKERESVLQELAESKEQYNILDDRFNKLFTEKQNNEMVIQNLLNALEQSKSEKENHKRQVENLEKKLQQTEKFRELPLSTDQKCNGSSLLPASVQSFEGKTEGDQPTNVKEQIISTPTTTAKDQTARNVAEQGKDELAGSHTKLSVVSQFVTSPLKDPPTETSENNQFTVLIKQKTIMRKQSSETLIKDQLKKTTVQGQLIEISAEDQQTETSSEDQQPTKDQQPADQHTETPAKDQLTEAPAKDQQPAEDQQTETPTKDQQPTEDQHTETPAKDQQIETPAKDQQPAEDQQTETPAKYQQPTEDQHTETPAKYQQIETPAKDQQSAEDLQPAEDQHTETPAKDQQPEEGQHTETPAEDQQPAKDQQPAEDQHTETPQQPAKDQQTTTPAKDQQPAEDQQTKTPAKDQQPIKDQQTVTPEIEAPAKDQQTTTLAKDQQTKTPAKDQQPIKDQQAVTPEIEASGKDQQTTIPAKDQQPTENQQPAEDQQTKTPAEDQQTKTPAEGQQKETPTKDQQTGTPAEDQHTAKDDHTETYNTKHNVNPCSMHKSPPSVPCIHSEEHSAEYTRTPFGLRKSFRRRKIAQDEKKPTSIIVDNQLQNVFDRRKKKNEDPKALEKFEEAVHKTMASTRASTKPNEDGKYFKEKVGDRGIDSELHKILQKQKNKTLN